MARTGSQAGDGHSQRWRKNNPAKNRQYYLKTLYGITPEEFARLVESHGGKCAICGETPKKLFVEHCHKTKKVRGLVCTHCNLILGHAHDSVEVLQNAIQYLKRNQL